MTTIVCIHKSSADQDINKKSINYKFILTTTPNRDSAWEVAILLVPLLVDSFLSVTLASPFQHPNPKASFVPASQRAKQNSPLQTFAGPLPLVLEQIDSIDIAPTRIDELASTNLQQESFVCGGVAKCLEEHSRPAFWLPSLFLTN